MYRETEARGRARRGAQPFELAPGRSGVGVVAGMELDRRRAGFGAGTQLRVVGVDEEAHADARRRESTDRRVHAGHLPRDVEPALGGQLLAPLRHEAGGVGTDAYGELDHRVGHRHLEVQRDP